MKGRDVSGNGTKGARQTDKDEREMIQIPISQSYSESELINDTSNLLQTLPDHLCSKSSTDIGKILPAAPIKVFIT